MLDELKWPSLEDRRAVKKCVKGENPVMDIKADRRSRQTYWNGPRTVLVPRTEKGFGFTLRHFIVYPPESAAKLQEREYISEDDTEELCFERIQHGNLEPLDTIFVKNIKDGGPAQLAGLNPGDRIISVNGEAVTGKSYGQVINLIQHSKSDLNLLVVPKDEDILQLAYESSSQSIDSDYGLASDSSGSSVYDHGHHYPHYPQSHTPSMENITHNAPRSSSRDRKLVSSSTSNLDSRIGDSVPSGRYGIDRDPLRSLTSSTSYTSGLSLYPQHNNDEAMNRAVFLDRKREFESRAAQENVNPQTKTYSFGLYYPKANKESRVSSVENLPRSVVIRRSRENILQPTDSQENISKTHRAPRVRNVPIEYRHSGTPDDKVPERFRSHESLGHETDAKPPIHHGSGSAIRHSFPDSGVQVWSSPTRHAGDINSPYQYDHGTTITENSPKRDSYSGSRQYVPVINQANMGNNSKMSASVDSIDPRSNVFHSEQYLRTAYNSPGPEQSNQNSSRTFIVQIGDRQSDMNKRSSTPNISHDSPNSSAQSYGTAFAITRSPATEIEIRKNEPRILVSHRKKQFEHTRNENTPPPANNNNGINRYKTEIKRDPLRKFDSVAQRVASFERQNSDSSRSRSQTPTQPNNKVRRMSQERVKSPEPSQNGSHSQGNIPANFTDSAQIRIYVSQGNSNNSGSPIVEILPMPANYDHSGSHGRQAEPLTHHDDVDGQGPDGGRDVADSDGQKPVRKASFLSAVNAPYSRYLPQTGYEHETPTPETPPKSSRVLLPANQIAARSANQTPTNFSWAARSQSPANAISPTSLGSSSNIAITASSITTTPVRDVTSTVRLRNKPEMSAEDYETKLHRRTSYLMATAKDKTTSTASLTMSPTMQLDPNTPATFSKHKSMRKLKDFFGEKTPKILEAQEKKPADPASPIQTVMKEGSLGYKVDLIDGKRAGDRSWRPVWAVLRGHALYLYKDKREPGTTAPQPTVFSYDEQPISVKACIVDIAHGYTKKKNVFRLQTYNMSEYLFQADDQETMLAWIEAIKRNNNPDKDPSGVASAELIIRKSQELESAAPLILTKTSPPASQKISKKTSVLSIKPKVMASPNAKHRKTSTEKDDTKQEKETKQKNWKNKLGKSIKKHIGSSPSPTIQTVQEVGGMFGVPLECCTPSPNNEFVPLIVDMCTQIVEAKGLEMTGVYRIPGNKAAVTLLQEEFNKGIESMNLDHEKWSDVNVISSLLKSFFRQLPEALVTDELYQSFIDANRIENPERRMLKLKRLIHELPEHHFETFKHLAKHLNRVAVYGDVNRMEAKNLAIVFGPTLIRKTDDNMTAMFTDMSDHCKIIESIILHCDWFFGSWDMDNYVPTDDDATECTSITSALTSSAREDLDNISINPQDIVTNIVEAANRKLRGQSPLKRSSADSPPKYNERNIDQEVLLRTRKIEPTSRSSPNIAAMQLASDTLSPNAQDGPTDRRMAKSQEFVDHEFSDFAFIDADKEPTSPVSVNRFLSEDSMMDRNDELEFSHSSLSSNYRLSRDTLDSLRKIEMEARALREREERRQRDLEKRKLEKQRIEQDILQTQQELENEDRHSVEDLLNAPEFSQWMSPYFYKRKHDTGQLRDAGSRGDYKSQKYGSSSANQSNVSRDSPNGGKYFVIKGNTATTSTPYERNSRPPRQTSVESLSAPSKRTSSLENMADSHGRSKGRPMAHVRGARKMDSDKSKRDSAEIKRRTNGALSRSNSVRRGSLDSLIDLIEKRDSRMSWASTDSDESFDLLTTLTHTFDKKLQTLSSPKQTQTTAPPPPRRQPFNSSLNSINTVTSDTSDTAQNAQRRLPPQVPLFNRSVGSSSDIHGKQYRDPSLHRTPPKPDAKIGLATRFERSTTYNPTYQAPPESSFGGVTNNSALDLRSDVTYSVDSANQSGIRNTPRTEVRVSSVMVVTPSPSVMSADSHQGGAYVTSHFISPPTVSPIALSPKRENQMTQSGSRSDLNSQSGLRLDQIGQTGVRSDKTSQSGFSSRLDQSNQSNGLKSDYRPISKSEKTEVNVKLSQLGDKNKNVNKNIVLSANNDNQNTVKSRSESPPPSYRKKTKKEKKRRHTVGGTNDSEHMKAMSDLPSPNRLSAWDQLQPALGNHSNIDRNSSMLTWIRNERLRGSSPDLSSNRFEKNIPRKS